MSTAKLSFRNLGQVATVRACNKSMKNKERSKCFVPWWNDFGWLLKWHYNFCWRDLKLKFLLLTYWCLLVWYILIIRLMFHAFANQSRHSPVYHQFRRDSISSLWKKHNLRLMRYKGALRPWWYARLRRDDMPLLSQWIKKHFCLLTKVLFVAKEQ